MPQSAEHLAAIDALGISRGLLAVTRADLADPGPARRRAAAEIAATSLGAVEAVAVSAVTGAGLPELRDALARLAAGLPTPAPGAPARLWVDRAFSIRGSGTVVTGTLPAWHHPDRRRTAADAVHAAGPGPRDRVAGPGRRSGQRRGPGRAEPARRGPGGARPRHGARPVRPLDPGRRCRRPVQLARDVPGGAHASRPPRPGSRVS